jgi:probable O-glycosylation ligase (exosortase A-associated)
MLIGLSILASYSRGAFLGAAAVSFYLFINSKKKAMLAPALVVAAILGLSFMPQKYFDRLSTIQTYEEDNSAMGRINSWYFAYHLANDRPIVGGGFSVFDPSTFQRYAPEPENFNDAHSIYFETLGEQGYVGLLIFLLLGFLALRQGNTIRKLTKDKKGLEWAFDLASMVQVSLIGYAVSGAFVGLAYFDLYYHLIAILVITKMAVDKELWKYNSTSAIEPTHNDDSRVRSTNRIKA